MTFARVAFDVVAVVVILFGVYVLGRAAAWALDRHGPDARALKRDPGAATRASIKARMPNGKTRPHA